MKRYAFPLTIILLMITVVALAAPGDKRPAVTSAAIGLGTNSSATMASVTATTSVTAPAYNSTAADGYHYVLPYNSVAFAGTPSVGMMQTTPTGPQWYTGSAWEAIGGGGGGTWGSITGTLSAQTDLQAALDAISAGGITMSTAIPSTPGSAYLNDSTHVLTVASSTGYTQFTGSFTAWDTTPDAFAFTDETDIAINTAKTSNAITVAGTNYPAAISVTGDTGFGYSKNSAACTATSGTVVAGDTVAACVTSSGSPSTATTATITIGVVSDTYSVTTAATGGGVTYTDNFNRTDQWPIAGDWLVVNGDVKLYNMRVDGASGGVHNLVRWSANTVASDQFSQASIVDISASNSAGPCVRVSSSATTGYCLVTSGSTTRIIKLLDGVSSDITTQVDTAATSDVYKLAVSGSNLTAYKNGVVINTGTDSSIASGSVGMYGWSYSNAIDNWSGGGL